jgi:hypothetical protein
MLISAYLDSRLTPSQTKNVVDRLETDAQFRAALNEISYTRRMLRALPQKRAPRNFTLPREIAKAPLKALWLQPALSYASAFSALLLVVVFIGSYLLGGSSLARPSSQPASEMYAAEDAARESDSPPLINWNPIMGMGGGDLASQEIYTGGGGIGGAGGPGFVTKEISTAEPEIPPDEMALAAEPLLESAPMDATATLDPLASGGGIVEPPMVAAIPSDLLTAEPSPTPYVPEVAATSEPSTATKAPAEQTQGDMSTLILGVPDEAQQGEMIPESQPAPVKPESKARPPYLLLAILGGSALLTGLAALLLRRR